jgi:hypothetical protein
VHIEAGAATLYSKNGADIEAIENDFQAGLGGWHSLGDKAIVFGLISLALGPKAGKLSLRCPNSSIEFCLREFLRRLVTAGTMFSLRCWLKNGIEFGIREFLTHGFLLRLWLVSVTLVAKRVTLPGGWNGGECLKRRASVVPEDSRRPACLSGSCLQPWRDRFAGLDRIQAAG